MQLYYLVVVVFKKLNQKKKCILHIPRSVSNKLLMLLLTGRIYRCLFSGSFSSLLTLPLDLLST